MNAILGLIPLLNSAIGVVGAFTGNATQARTSGAVQDALGVITAVLPLVQSFGQGTDVTPAQVKAALAGKDAALAAFDLEIGKHETRS